MVGHKYEIGDRVIFVEDAFDGMIKRGSVGEVVGFTGKPFTPCFIEVNGIRRQPFPERYVPLRVTFNKFPEGVKEGDLCHFSDHTGREGTWRLQDRTLSGRYVDENDCIWDFCRPIQKPRRFKKASEIIAMLEDEGFTFVQGSDTNASRYVKGGAGKGSYSIMFIHLISGKSEGITTCASVPGEWLEEVEA